jgi:hypothetical protein
MKQCDSCKGNYEEPGVPHPVRWSDTKCKFVAEMDRYCCWSCAYIGTIRTRSDHLMGLLNFMFMHYTQSNFAATTTSQIKNLPASRHQELLAAFLEYCIPYTQIISMEEINRLESIQENKYLKSLYKKRTSHLVEMEPRKIQRLE